MSVKIPNSRTLTTIHHLPNSLLSVQISPLYHHHHALPPSSTSIHRQQSCVVASVALSRFTDCKSPPATDQFENSARTSLPPPPRSASVTDHHPPSTVVRRQLNLCASLSVSSKNWFPYAFCCVFFTVLVRLCCFDFSLL